MNQSYIDIIDALGEPQWWDERGVPRYCKPDPRRAANIYASEVALIEVACQGCGRVYRVLMSASPHFGAEGRAKPRGGCAKTPVAPKA